MFIAYEPDNQMMFFFTEEERDAYVAEWWPFADTEPYEESLQMPRD